MLEINNIRMPATSLCDIEAYDVVDGGRNGNGYMLFDEIATKRKILAEWEQVNAEDAKLILSAVKNKYFRVKYLDPETGRYETKTFYKGPRLISTPIIINNTPIYKRIKINFIEP